MAEPTDSYPETATNAASKTESAGDGEAALRDALDAHGEDLAAVIERTDDLDDALTTAVLIAASADDAELDYLTTATANLIQAGEGLATEEAAALAEDLGENADDLAATLDTVLALQREGHLDDFVTIATAFSESLSPDEVEDLAAMLEADGAEAVAALDTVLDLKREGHLEDLVALGGTLSALELDEDAAEGLNALLGAVGEAERDSDPVGLVGLLGQLRNRDARAGLGYLVAVLQALGRRVRNT
jgi:uncharacterized protein YjgD (DUF1641 family)